MMRLSCLWFFYLILLCWFDSLWRSEYGWWLLLLYISNDSEIRNTRLWQLWKRQQNPLYFSSPHPTPCFPVPVNRDLCSRLVLIISLYHQQKQLQAGVAHCCRDLYLCIAPVKFLKSLTNTLTSKNLYPPVYKSTWLLVGDLCNPQKAERAFIMLGRKRADPFIYGF